MPGTPSMSLRRATPCQCTVVSTGSWLIKSTRSRSPARARRSGPGRLSPYAQVRTVGPPRSRVTGRGVSRAVTSRPPAAWRVASARRTASEVGATAAPPSRPHPPTMSSPAAPAAPARSRRRLAHVARAPMSSKMAAGSWRKWYNGTWTEPGVGGRESNMVPVTSANTNGYTPTSADYDPANTGTTDQQIASGELPSKSPLFVMNIAYDAYLGLYIGEPEVISGTAPQQFYVTDDLATQKWYLAGDSGSYKSGSWYRGNGRVLAQVSGSTATTSVASGTGSNLEAWSFTGNGDGSYRITNASTGQALGVDSGTTSTRAWGAKPTVTTIG